MKIVFTSDEERGLDRLQKLLEGIFEAANGGAINILYANKLSQKNRSIWLNEQLEKKSSGGVFLFDDDALSDPSAIDRLDAILRIAETASCTVVVVTVNDAAALPFLYFHAKCKPPRRVQYSAMSGHIATIIDTDDETYSFVNA